MPDDLRIHQKFIAIHLVAGRIRSNVTAGVRAGRVNTLAIWRR